MVGSDIDIEVGPEVEPEVPSHTMRTQSRPVQIHLEDNLRR